MTNNTNAMGAGATIIINAGTVEIGGAGRLENGSYAGAITNNGTFNYNSSADQTLSGVISGNGALVKSNASTLTLSGANTYTGATTVTGAVLAVNASLGNTSTTIGNLGTLQGSGTIVGSVTVESGGTLAPGNSIESIGTGALSFQSGSTYAYELQTDLYASTPGVAADLTYSSSTLDITAGAILTLTDLATSTALAGGSKFTLISYFGGWEGTELFSYDSGSGLATLADDSTFTLGANQWLFNYNDIAGGDNYTSDQSGAGGYVTMTVIPEPNVAALLGGLGAMLLLRRRR